MILTHQLQKLASLRTLKLVSTFSEMNFLIFHKISYMVRRIFTRYWLQVCQKGSL